MPSQSCSTKPLSSSEPAVALPQGRSLIWLAAGVFLIAVNLRTLFPSLSVILPELMASTGLSASAASVLTTLPVLCLGVFAIPAPALARRFGTERALMGALVLLTLGLALRATPSHTLLFAASAMAGAGIAMCNVLLPSLIKRDFGPWTAAMTGLFTMGLCAGAAVPAAATQPLRDLLGQSWMAALAIWMVPSLIATLVWLPRALQPVRTTRLSGQRPAGLWASPLAWQVTLFMGLQSALAYIMMGWLPPMLRERGLPADTAGYIMGIAIFLQVFSTLTIPPLAARLRHQSLLALAITAITTLSFVASLTLPLATVWLWCSLLGLGLGASIALAIMLIVLRSPDTQTTAQLSGMAQGIGYMVAAAGPLIAGILHDLSGNFDDAVYLILLIGIVQGICGYGAGRSRHVTPKRS